MNLEASENLKRVLATIPASELSMSDWGRCAIGHACRDAWFHKRGLRPDFESAASLFEINQSDAHALFSPRAGRTPEEVMAFVNEFIGRSRQFLDERNRHARRQAIIHEMLALAIHGDANRRAEPASAQIAD